MRTSVSEVRTETTHFLLVSAAIMVSDSSDTRLETGRVSMVFTGEVSKYVKLGEFLGRTNEVVLQRRGRRGSIDLCSRENSGSAVQYSVFQFAYLPVPALNKQVTKRPAMLSFAGTILKEPECSLLPDKQ